MYRLMEHDYMYKKAFSDSGFQAVNSRLQVLRDSGFLVNLTWISNLIACGIPDSLSWILDFKAQDFGFFKQNIPDSGIWIILPGTKCYLEKHITWF